MTENGPYENQLCPRHCEAATLDELATVANREAGLAVDAATALMQHAINCGEALLAAKQQVPRGQWEDWLAANFERSSAVATQSMRIARHKEIVVEGQATTFKGALRLLHQHGARDARTDPVEYAEVMRLRSEGMAMTAIARELSIPYSRVFNWCNPKRERERLERARRRTVAGRRALERQKRDADAKKVGGTTGHAYSLVRRALQALERAAEEEKDKDAKIEIRHATNRLYNAEDHIIKAVRLHG